jgi:large subunit ribosomal protein L17
MRHLIKGRILNRKPAHRAALLRNLACQLFAHERIETTLAKAKELRPFAERLITIAKRGALAALSGTADARLKTLHARRLLIARLGGKHRVVVGEDLVNVVDKLINDIGPRFRGRPGGYCRVLKLARRRLGDAAPAALIELLRSYEEPAPPAPRVEPTASE